MLYPAAAAASATHMSLNTMGCGFKSAGEHIEAIRKFAEAVGMG
jgi:hypothetical protein